MINTATSVVTTQISAMGAPKQILFSADGTQLYWAGDYAVYVYNTAGIDFTAFPTISSA